MATQLEILANQFRKEQIVRNAYTDQGEYGSGNKNALSDGAQSLTPAQFAEVMKKIKAQADFMGRKIG